jgi:type II secretory pathway predicted ATPase ExeA
VYYRYYGLQAFPFAVTPSGASLYMGSAHREAFAALQWGLRDPNGFALIVGEPGTGKTSLVLALLEAQHEAIRIIHLSQARSFAEILDLIAAELEIDRSNVSETEFARLIEGKLNSLGMRLVLLFDEAQALDNSTLEQLRLFANNIVDASAVMQIVFIGQRELLDRLKQPALRALDQRIATRAELLPLRPREVREYVEHRLRTYGGSVNELFSRAALRSLVRNGLLIPREINLICHGALILAYVSGSRRVTAPMIREAFRHYRGLSPSSAGLFRRWSKYFKATHRQTATLPICVGAILSSLFLLPRPTANLHDEPVNLCPIKSVPPLPSKGQSEDAAVRSPTLVAGPDAQLIAAVPGPASTSNPIHEDKLKVPRSVIVEDGDTLSSLAEANLGSKDHEAVQRLLNANPLLADPDLIHPGQTVFLPSDSE